MKRVGRLRLLAPLMILFGLTAKAQISKDHQHACKAAKSHIADVYCVILDDEFRQQRFMNNSYPPNQTLVNPLNQSALFADAVLDTALLHVASNALSAAIKDTTVSAVQTELNQLAQTLSTKAAVPQTGATASASGSTGLVSKPTTTDLISLASESGAFTDTVNGSTLTAQVNANGLRRYLVGENFSSLSPTALDVLQHLTIAATFNVAQGGTTSAPTTGQATNTTPASITSVILPSNNLTFTSVGVGWAIYRPYTPTSSAFGSAWASAIGAHKSDIIGAATTLYTDYLKAVPNQQKVLGTPTVKAALNVWVAKAADNEKLANNRGFESFVSGFVTFVKVIIVELETDSSFDQTILNVAADVGKLQEVRNTALDTARGSLSTINYTYSTPPGKPATHDATAVLSYVWAKHDKGAQITFNGAGSWFATIAPGAKYGRVKDYQISGEFDQPIGADRSSPRATFSVAGYGQYQYAANILNVTVANVVPGTDVSVPQNSQVFTSTPGWLGVAQTKLSFNIGKGVTIPVAVKWSNKTDLLTDSDWKGQFGLRYDLSALSSILQAK